MLHRSDWFWLGGALLLAVGCGVQEHELGKAPIATAGAAGSSGGAAGVGAAGTGLPSVSGAAGDSNQTGAAGDVGGTGSAGTTGAAGTGSGTTGAAGTGAPSGGSVVIGGVTVPKENAIAFIHFGHSNMAGRGRMPASAKAYHFSETDPHAWMYHSAALAPYIAGAKAGFELAIEPKTAGDKFNARQPTNPAGGPGTTLVKQAAALAPGKYFISLGFGVGSVYCTEYLPGGLYYDQVITAAKELKGKVTFAAIIILLGITERHGTTADVQNFPNCLNQLVTAVRMDVGEPNLPMILNGYEMGSNRLLAPTTAFAQTIIPRIAAVPTIVSNSAVVPTDNPLIPIESEPNEPDGDHHFTLDGHKEYMRRVLQTMKDKGWWRW